MTMSVNDHVRWLVGRPTSAQHATALPPLPPGTQPTGDSLFDRLGRGISSSAAAVGAAGVIGGVLAGGVGAVAGAGVVSLVAGSVRAPGTVDGGAQAKTGIRAPEQLRVMTWNLHGGMGGRGSFFASEEDLDRIAEEVRRQQPDVLVLQEVDLSAPRSGYRDVLAGLVRRLNPTSAVSGAGLTRLTGRSQHVAVMTFHDVTVTNARNLVHEDRLGNSAMRRVRGTITDAHKLVDGIRHKHHDDAADAIPAIDVRDTLDTMIHTPAGNDVRVITGHYSGRSASNDGAAASLFPLAATVGAWSGATLLAGDFNVVSSSPDGVRERRVLGAVGLRDAFEAVGIQPGDARRASTQPPETHDIDRIYTSQQVAVSSIATSATAGTASDHVPVIADVVLR